MSTPRLKLDMRISSSACAPCTSSTTTPSADSSGKNEVILFEAVTEYILAWNATRKARFGDAGCFYVELDNGDGTYQPAAIPIMPNNIINTTSYRFDFGGTATGRITIT